MLWEEGEVKHSTEPISFSLCHPSDMLHARPDKAFSQHTELVCWEKSLCCFPGEQLGSHQCPRASTATECSSADQWDPLGIFQSQTANSIQIPICAFPAQQRAVAAAEAKQGSWSSATSVNYLCSVAWGCRVTATA